MADDKHYVVGQGTGILQPNRACDQRVDVKRDLPGTFILVHGVNDIGVSYPAQEEGLCKGLNERLCRKDMMPGQYKTPKRDDELLADPDAVYYRRSAGDGTYSPVIPFYWGYRLDKNDRDVHIKNGQNVDKHGNRLDKNYAVAGGMFANATSDIPSMFSGHYVRTNAVAAVEAGGGDVYHPLRDGADRRYMNLAAKRLAMLVAEIRKRDANETVTLVGHSQDCMLSLLAQAFLAEQGARSADCLILNHPPYSLHEQFADRAMQGNGGLQQTTRARLETLAALVKKVTEKPHAEPPLAELADCMNGKGRAGNLWTPTSGKRPGLEISGKHIVFAERDNRGKVYLYFCPADQTVGLYNVQGIGTLGVPEKLQSLDQAGHSKTYEPLRSLGPRFLQRVWTTRPRDGKLELVGKAPYTYTLVTRFEDDYPDAGFMANKARVSPDANETRHINAEELNPKCEPRLTHGEPTKGKLNVDPIDASITVANDGIKTPIMIIDDPTGSPGRPSTPQDLVLNAADKGKVDAVVNKGRKPEPEDQRTVVRVVRHSSGKLAVTYRESPNEARLRHQSKEVMDNSYHSSIVANAEHSRLVTAMDVAIGQAKALNDPGWRKLLNDIADWRIPIGNIKDNSPREYQKLGAESPESCRLIEANCAYYAKGEFPDWVMPQKLPSGVVMPTGVVSETRTQRADTRMQELQRQQEAERRRHIDARNRDRQRAGLPPLP